MTQAWRWIWLLGGALAMIAPQAAQAAERSSMEGPLEAPPFVALSIGAFEILIVAVAVAHAVLPRRKRDRKP